MYSLKEFSNKLKKTAEMIDDLIGVNLNLPTTNENSKTANKIIKHTKKNIWTPARRKAQARRMKTLWKTGKL